MEGLREAGIEDGVIAAIQMDIASARIAEKERVLLYLAEELTLDPASAAKAVRNAVGAGWSNEEIAHAIFLVSYFNMATRIVDAFNLPPDEYHQFDPNDSLPLLYRE